MTILYHRGGRREKASMYTRWSETVTQQWRKQWSNFIRILPDWRKEDVSVIIVNLLKHEKEYQRRKCVKNGRKGAGEVSQ